MYVRTGSYVLLDTSYAYNIYSYTYNMYSYMSDMYLIPKTCTRTCLFLEYPGVMARSFLKIDMGRRDPTPGAISQCQSHTALCDPSVSGAEMRVELD